MKLILRLTLITLTIVLGVGALLAAVQMGAVQSLLPTEGGRNQPELTGEGNASQFVEGGSATEFRPPAFEGSTDGLGLREERAGGGWRGLGEVTKSLGIFAGLFVAMMGLSTVINRIPRWRTKPAQL